MLGKGSKTRLVPATGEQMTELMRYRRSQGLPPLPLEGDVTPLVVPLIGPNKPMARSALHEVLKEIFRSSAARMRAQGTEFEAAAVHLEAASAHWVRHTAGSHLPPKDIWAIRFRLQMVHRVRELALFSGLTANSGAATSWPCGCETSATVTV